MSTAPRPLTLPELGAVVAGNALEFYYFLTFSFFAVQIGAVFFPGKDTTSSLLFVAYLEYLFSSQLAQLQDKSARLETATCYIARFSARVTKPRENVTGAMVIRRTGRPPGWCLLSLVRKGGRIGQQGPAERRRDAGAHQIRRRPQGLAQRSS